ncbi:Hint domain-containing protein [Xinfangfangia sp. D13-10-4-6]|uniref:Hint domain-containing protein n=1 Tax=Pseudogemmobacter hezensis TaxID=2737662 RepID=UPI0015547C6F|nr:Hint domain-containing protein [Pseudogemmobacter hezensis]NPD15791.1 Hint domain-containing protein [Pseudogemmobacter hezensis]
MPLYYVNVYTADSFTYSYNGGPSINGLPAEHSSGSIDPAANPSATRHLVLTLKPNAVPIRILIEDNDTGRLSGHPNSNTSFDEVSNAQHIVGGTYNAGALINGAYTMFTGANGTGDLLVTYRLNGNNSGIDAGPVQGLISSIPLSPGQSIHILSSRTTDTAALPYAHYDGGETAPCFTPGTLITTNQGDLPVENLRPGDRVLTRDHGFQVLRWVGRRIFTAQETAENPRILPITLCRGVLGNDMPSQDLVVSPQHRILLRSEVVKRYFGSSEALVPAKKLLGLPGVSQGLPGTPVTYLHLLFDEHEVVLSNEAWTESLMTGRIALEALGLEAIAEIRMIFPDLLEREHQIRSARPVVKGREGRLLLREIEQSALPFVD